MAFKTAKSYNEEKFGGYFLLRNDGDYADVVFLYQSVEDVLVADVHYIKSNEYSGYAHCCGSSAGCPACAKGIRTQTKLFIPLYNIKDNEIQFFDRTMRFEPQLQQDVFSKYANPSEFVFRITRHGEAGSVDTTYEIVAVGKNTMMPYAQILANHNATMPEYYNTICKDLSAAELQRLVTAGDRPTNEYTPSGNYVAPSGNSYAPIPRGAAAAPAQPAPAVEVPQYSMPPETLPDIDEDSDGDADTSEELDSEPQF